MACWCPPGSAGPRTVIDQPSCVRLRLADARVSPFQGARRARPRDAWTRLPDGALRHGDLIPGPGPGSVLRRWQGRCLRATLYPVLPADTTTVDLCRGCYIYPPTLAQVLAPIHAAGYQALQVVWFSLQLLAMLARGYRLGRTGWRWTPFWILVAFSFPFVVAELYGGNIHLLMAVAIDAIGFRHPWTWSFVLLTKPSSGVGLLWFVVRREWRQAWHRPWGHGRHLFGHVGLLAGTLARMDRCLSRATWRFQATPAYLEPR